MIRRFAFLYKGVAVVVAAALASAPLRPALASEFYPVNEPPASPGVLAAGQAALMVHIENIAAKDWETGLSKTLLAARSLDPAEAMPARLALALVIEPEEIERIQWQSPTRDQAGFVALAHHARQLPALARTSPSLKLLVDEAKELADPLIKGGDLRRASERLDAFFEQALHRPVIAEAEPGLGSLPARVEASRADWLSAADMPSPATPAGKKHLGLAVQRLKKATPDDLESGRVDAAALVAGAYLERHPHAPEVQALVVRDEGLRASLAAHAEAGSDQALSLGVELEKRVSTKALGVAEFADWSSRWRRRLAQVGGVSLAALAAATPGMVVALAALGVGGSVVAISVLRRMSAEAEASDRASSARHALERRAYDERSGGRASALGKYKALVKRQVEVQAKARRLEAAFVGVSVPDPDALGAGDAFEIGLTKLLRHPKARVRAQAKSILQEHVAAELQDAWGSRRTEDMGPLAAHLLLLHPETAGWKDRLRAIELYVLSTLGAAGLRDGGQFIESLRPHLEFLRGSESVALLPAAHEAEAIRETALVASGASREKVVAAIDVLSQTLDVLEAGWEPLVVSAAVFLRRCLEGPHAGIIERRLLRGGGLGPMLSPDAESPVVHGLAGALSNQWTSKLWGKEPAPTDKFYYAAKLGGQAKLAAHSRAPEELNELAGMLVAYRPAKDGQPWDVRRQELLDEAARQLRNARIAVEPELMRELSVWLDAHRQLELAPAGEAKLE